MPRAKTNKVGRPPKPKREVLGAITPIRFTDAEKASYEKLATKAGLTLSEWVRRTLKNCIQ